MPDIRNCMQKIETLVNEFQQAADPNVRTQAVELVQAMMELHGTGLQQMLSIIRQSGDSGSAIIDRLAQDELTGHLLMLYDLHPVDLPTRVDRALEQVRPQLQSHGGDVELIGLSDEGTLTLRMEGSCNGCPSSAMTLKSAIEEAIAEHAPDIGELIVEGVVSKEDTSGPLVQLSTSSNGAAVR